MADSYYFHEIYCLYECVRGVLLEFPCLATRLLSNLFPAIKAEINMDEFSGTRSHIEDAV